MKKVWVCGPHYERITQDIFRDAGFEVVDDQSSADVVVLTGGSDVSPWVYNEEVNGAVFCDQARDEYELDVVDDAIFNGQILIGICRGFQFIHAYLGGKLVQDLGSHEGSTHRVRDRETGLSYIVNSYHHQAVSDLSLSKGELLAVANKDGIVEAAFWPEERAMGVQFHPEFGHATSRSYFFHLFNKFLERTEDGQNTDEN